MSAVIEVRRFILCAQGDMIANHHVMSCHVIYEMCPVRLFLASVRNYLDPVKAGTQNKTSAPPAIDILAHYSVILYTSFLLCEWSGRMAVACHIVQRFLPKNPKSLLSFSLACRKAELLFQLWGSISYIFNRPIWHLQEIKTPGYQAIFS